MDKDNIRSGACFAGIELEDPAVSGTKAMSYDPDTGMGPRLSSSGESDPPKPNLKSHPAYGGNQSYELAGSHVRHKSQNSGNRSQGVRRRLLAVCAAAGCGAELTSADVHRNLRASLCRVHQRAPYFEAAVGGGRQRFCQQCQRAHPLDRFEGTKRGCRKRLERHNSRRRKCKGTVTGKTTRTGAAGGSYYTNLAEARPGAVSGAPARRVGAVHCDTLGVVDSGSDYPYEPLRQAGLLTSSGDAAAARAQQPRSGVIAPPPPLGVFGDDPAGRRDFLDRTSPYHYFDDVNDPFSMAAVGPSVASAMGPPPFSSHASFPYMTNVAPPAWRSDRGGELSQPTGSSAPWAPSRRHHTYQSRPATAAGISPAPHSSSALPLATDKTSSGLHEWQAKEFWRNQGHLGRGSMPSRHSADQHFFPSLAPSNYHPSLPRPSNYPPSRPQVDSFPLSDPSMHQLIPPLPFENNTWDTMDGGRTQADNAAPSISRREAWNLADYQQMPPGASRGNNFADNSSGRSTRWSTFQ